MTRRLRASSPTPSSSTIHIDLTAPAASSSSSSATTSETSAPSPCLRPRRHHHHHHHHPQHVHQRPPRAEALTVSSPPSDRRFTAAYRRVHTRRDRVYTQNGLFERVCHTDERPALAPFTLWLSNLLVAVAVLAAAALLLHLAHALYCDIMRKTTSRAHQLEREASQCHLHFRTNQCESASSPALSRLCLEWRQCVSRGRSAFRHAFSLTVFAEIAADMFNTFGATVTSKGVIVALVFFALLLCFGSVLFRLFASPRRPPPLSPLFQEQYWSRPVQSLPSPPPEKRTPLVAWSADKTAKHHATQKQL
ncbi:unnamed protein product [Agarophyton chilense]